MAHHEVLLKVKALVAPQLERTGYVLVDLGLYRNQAGVQILKVLADRPDGGITLNECGTLNREIGALLEREGVLMARYLLDVSSPGIDRPMTQPADFRRAKGRRIRVFLSVPVAEKIEHCGILDDVGADAIRLALDDPSAQAPAMAGGFRSGCRPKGGKKGPTGMPTGLHKTIDITYDKINKAKQVVT